jgi:hypothetical protein
MPEVCETRTILELDNLPKGTVVGEQFASYGVHIAAMNTGGGPDLAIVFDSSNPSGGDFDLGSPNETFGGPGIGVGGEMGQPGANSTALGHLLIVAENAVDANGDGRIDDPDDEAGGGIIKFNFDVPTDVISLQIVDIDEINQGFVVAYDGANQVIANVPMQMLGDNSVQRLVVNALGARRLEVVFPGSGAISDLELCLPIVSIDIRKQEEGPDTRTVPAGQPVDFEIKVTNTGNTDLSNVVVTDAKAPQCDRVIGNLPAGGMVTYTCTVPAATIGGGSGGTMTFKDTFTVHQYNNNDGDTAWSGPWIEDDVADGNTQSPANGNVIIGSNDKLWFDDNPDTGTEPSARRTADLSGKTSAVLSFDYQTHAGVDADDAVVAEVSANGGASYTVLETFTGIVGAVTGSRSYDISAYISSQTTIRFRVSNLYGGADETFKVDNVMIVGEGSGDFVNQACVAGQGAGLTAQDCDTSTVVTGQPCEEIVIEAEHSSYYGDFSLLNDAAASGGKALKTINGDNMVGPDAGSRADFDFTILVGGNYRIRGYVHAATGSDDSFWVTVDGLPSAGILWDTLQNTQYQADFVGDRNGADPVEVYFSAGSHRVTLYKREDGTRIDKLEIVCAEAPPTPTPGGQTESVGAFTSGESTARAGAATSAAAGTLVVTPTPDRATVDAQRAPTATPTPTPVPGDSCAGNCGGTAGSCNCDPKCVQYGDCCHDYAQQCERD